MAYTVLFEDTYFLQTMQLISFEKGGGFVK